MAIVAYSAETYDAQTSDPDPEFLDGSDSDQKPLRSHWPPAFSERVRPSPKTPLTSLLEWCEPAILDGGVRVPFCVVPSLKLRSEKKAQTS
jgi:hypothetical protein